MSRSCLISFLHKHQESFGCRLSQDPSPAWGGDADAGDAFFDSLALCFPCVLQIGGPRGEKGQKGEPAIIEPVRTIWFLLVPGLICFVFTGENVPRVCLVWPDALSAAAGRKMENFPWKNYLVNLKTLNIKHSSYYFSKNFKKQSEL